ncbi:MAG: pilus assembly protein PilZ [Sphingopyxis macrogoltabida]|uniref:Pilus assembly protein PilZ n=1 Tax=Sphingopyxis macrogoltabida TaxID=33050 RepID=A0A2W5MSL4_SPHMC|nr:MAG: pilus assembly protein PilZ [Sphingopyxis macrogoltabida]
MDSRGPVSLDEEVAALSRSDDRDSLFMQAPVSVPGRSDAVMVRVRNLSAGGMLAESVAAVEQGSPVVVDLRNVGPVPGRVVWSGEGKFGIAFDRPVNPQAVRRQVVQKAEVPAHIQILDRGPFYRRR